ncbi:MAG: PDZ domain-containing protein, partial [Lachnospiraceae bacterium]|nr:PDZ domain-containing protein [Lachnospiraceae bacterium]
MSNLKCHEHLILDVVINSPADEAGIVPGDKLVYINDKLVEDVLDFHFYETDEKLKLTVRRNEELLDFLIEKDEDDELGLEFESSLMDEYKSCHNKCIFCF